MRGILLWPLGIPIPIIILLFLFDVIRPEVKAGYRGDAAASWPACAS